MKLFYVQFSWYNDSDDKDEEQRAIIPGENYSDAVKAIESQFQYINEINFKEITYDCGDAPIIYLPDDGNVIEAVINENSY